MSELLAMLSAKSPALLTTGGNAKPALTPEMVAASLCGLPRRTYLYGLLKFCLDSSVKKEFYELTRNCVLKQAHVEGWKLAKSESEERFVRMGLLALRQALVAHCCCACSGSGRTEKKLACKVCGGSGAGRSFSQRTLADILNVSHKRVRSFWMAKYRDQESLYIGFDTDIYDHVRAGLKD